MYLGEIVEIAPTKELFENPKHPYTQGLLKSIPQINTDGNEEILTIQGEAQTNETIINGCKFAKRCPFVMEQCVKEHPEKQMISKEHFVKCFLYN